MRNLYGNRSIIPNNYYFTFDKIYENEEQVNTARNDGILIGRAVLAYAEHTVWLKTNLGYIKVAKLDNEGRFAYLEGKVLTEEDNIDLIHSNGNSYNDDGIYIINKNDYAKTQLTEEDIVYHIPQGTYPNIMGSDKYATYNGNNVIDDNSQRTFLLEQYSNIVTAQKNDNDSGIKYWESVTWQQAQDIISGTILYKEPDLAAKKYVNTTELSTEKLTTYYYPIKFDVETYQIMTDISIDDQTDNKAIDTSIQAKLSHNNKIFIRKCTFTYDIATETEEATYQYTFDSGNLKMIGTGVATLVNETTNTIFKKSIKEEGWSNWEDISEQYTGYLGALNGTGFNHVNTKFVGKDDETHSGQGNYLTLVDAINQLDRVIGSTNVRFVSGENISGNTIDEGVTKTDSISNYSVAIPGDTRKVQLRATNLANAIVRLALNIGQFEDIEDLNNMTFSHTLKTSDNSIKNTEDDNIATINSLTDAIKIIDQMIGVYSNIDGDDINKITTEANDKRPIHEAARNKTISDTIQHILADIGEIEEIGTNTNNLAFTKNANEETTIDSNNPVSMGENDKVKVYSIVSALRALDNMIGDYSDIDNNLGNRPVHGTKEDGTGQPISETIQHILADIGEIEKLNENNYKFDKNSESDLNTNEQAKVFSIVSALKALDKIIGDYKTIDNSPYETDKLNRPTHLAFNSITENLKHLSADIGEIESISPESEDEWDIYNLWYNADSDLAGDIIPDDKNNWQASIYSLTDAIKALDAVIGPFKSRSNTNDLFNEAKKNTSTITTPSLMGAINFINDKLIGDLSTNDGKTSTNKIDYKTIQNALNQLDKYLGVIKNLDSKNGTNINKNLVDAINILNKLIGDCSEIVNKQDQTTINENMPIVKHIKEIYEYYEILRQMINNLGENLDILDLNVTNLMNSGGSNVNLEWGTF